MIEQLFQMPSMEKQENGDYTYPTKYTNKLFKSGDTLVFFNLNSTTEYPIGLYNSVSEAIKKDILDSQQEELSSIDASINTLTSDFEDVASDTKDFNSSISKLRNDLSVVQKNLDRVESTLTHVQSKEEIQEVIRTEMAAVKDNFDSVMKEAIKKEAEKLLADSKKVDPMTILMMTKQGMDMKDVIDLAKSGVL
jgi:chromosome segregation ATPase